MMSIEKALLQILRELPPEQQIALLEQAEQLHEVSASRGLKGKKRGLWSDQTERTSPEERETRVPDAIGA